MKRTFTFTLISALFTLALPAAAVLASPQNAPQRDRTVNHDRQQDQYRQQDRRSRANDQKPASVLVYNFYTSDATNNFNKANTEINITNTSERKAAAVHIFLIDGASCATADTYICLTPNQTATFLASEVDPGATGYIIAVASDAVTGCPVSFNHLIGSEAVKLADGRAASFQAEGFAALYNGVLPGCQETNQTALADLDFDGVRYDQAPRRLAVDKLGSLADGASTLLIVNSLNGNMATGATKLSDLAGLLADDVENLFSFSRSEVKCQLAATLSDSFPQTTPSFSQVIPQGRTGWLSLMARENRGITGAMINFNPNTATRANAFNSGHNLHHLEYTNARVTIPVLPPFC